MFKPPDDGGVDIGVAALPADPSRDSPNNEQSAIATPFKFGFPLAKDAATKVAEPAGWRYRDGIRRVL